MQCRNQEASLGTKRRPAVGKHDLQQRVTELETALLSISQKLGTTPTPTESDNGAAEALQHLRSGILPSTPLAPSDSNSEALLKHAPILSLFDNAILSRWPDDTTKENVNGIGSPGLETNSSSYPRIDYIRRALLSLFPSQQRQEAILNSSDNWWSHWQDLYPHVFDIRPFFKPVQFVADLRDSGSVQKITKALLFIFVILQEASPSLDTSYDMTSAASKTSHGLSVIDEMVLGDDGLAGTIDGLECIVLRAKQELNNGRIRKAWLTMRRGISLAQLSGLHKRPTIPATDTTQSLRRDNLWKALYSGDRFLSLMLGLPYGATEIHSDIGRDSELSAKGINVPNTGEHYLNRLAHIYGHIIDRNQQLPSNNMLPLTFKIEAELLELSASMTSDWWGSGLEPDGAVDRMYSQLLPQFLHHQARALLHLPFMLKATTDRVFQYSKTATLESAREMIARYRVIRPAQGFRSLVCKMIDFQIFTAAMILVLNLLDHYRKSDLQDHSEAEKDQGLISEITDILQRASVETDGGVSTQAAKALEMFSNIKDFSLPVARAEELCTAKVVIPYFGTVAIGPGTSLKERDRVQKPDSMFQVQQMPTPSDQSLDGSTPESAPASNFRMEPMMPFEFDHAENSQGTGVNGNLFADVNFDLDQDWNWFWNNIDIPSVDPQGTVPG